MIEIIKKLTKVEDETLINYYIDKACTMIKEYLRTDKTTEDIQIRYKEAIIQAVVIFSRETKEGGNVQSKSQGARSVTYVANTSNNLDNSVKALLPKPKVRCY